MILNNWYWRFCLLKYNYLRIFKTIQFLHKLQVSGGLLFPWGISTNLQFDGNLKMLVKRLPLVRWLIMNYLCGEGEEEVCDSMRYISAN